MDFNELLFREMSPYVVVGFAGWAAYETKKATHFNV